MIQESFTLSKKSWHVRYMKWIWGWDHTDFYNMCPYFWLSVFNVLFAPFIVILKLLVIGIKRLDGYLEKQSEKAKQRQSDEVQELIDRLKRGEETEEDAAFIARCYHRYYINDKQCYRDDVLFHRLERYILPDKTADNHHISGAFNRMAYAAEDMGNAFFKSVIDQVIALQSPKKSVKPTDLLKYVKPIGQFIGGVLALVGAGLVVWFIYWLLHQFTMGEFLNALYYFAIYTPIIVISVFVLLVIISQLVEWRESQACSDKEPNALEKGWSFIGNTFMAIWYGIVGFFKLIRQMYKNNCPAIEWEEDK